MLIPGHLSTTACSFVCARDNFTTALLPASNQLSNICHSCLIVALNIRNFCLGVGQALIVSFAKDWWQTRPLQATVFGKYSPATFQSLAAVTGQVNPLLTWLPAYHLLGRGQAIFHRNIAFPAEARIPAVEDAEHWRHKRPCSNWSMTGMGLACFHVLTAAFQNDFLATLSGHPHLLLLKVRRHLI